MAAAVPSQPATCCYVLSGGDRRGGASVTGQPPARPGGMRSGGGGSGGGCGFKRAPGARESAGRSFAAAHPRGAKPGAGRTGQPAAGLLRTSPRPLLEGPSSEDVAVCGARPTPTPCQTTAFTCVFRCFPCDPSCGSAPWATPEFTPRSAAPMVKMTRSKTFQAYLPSCHRTYSCIHCRAHLANHDELISKSFQGSQGRAYLFNSVVNVGCGPAEERVLLTGLHAVADIYCENCKTTLGWKY
ncbi:protein yippee-like 2 isoform 3-T4 [Molossus nigricans]